MKKENKKGAGKPAFFSKPMKRINVMLDEDTVKFYTEQGKGNLSKGIRENARGLTSRAPDEGYCAHDWSFPPEFCPVCNKRVPLIRLRG